MIQIINKDYRDIIASLAGQYSIIITDPPYNISKADGSIKNLKNHKDIEQDFGKWDYQFNVPEFFIYTDRVPIIAFTSHTLFGAWIEQFNKRYEHNSFAVWHKCLAGNTPIFVIANGTGYRSTIKDIARLKSEVYLPGTGGQWRRVIHCEYTGEMPALLVTFRDGYSVVCSHKHRFLLGNGYLTEAISLQVGDIILSDTFPMPMNISCSELTDYEFGKFTGWFLAEGNYEKESCIRFSLGSNEYNIAEWLCQFASKRWNAQTRIHNIKGHNTIAVIITSKAVRGAIEEFISGKGSKGKRLSRSTWRCPVEFMRGIIDGWLDGDAQYDTLNRRYRFNIGDNRDLIEDMRVVSNLCGYSFRAKSRIGKIKDKEFPIFSGEVRKDKSLTYHSHPSPNNEIVSIRDVGTQQMYELEVDGDHLFVLPNGVVTHNSNPVPSVRKVTMVSSVELIAIGGRPSINFTKQNEMHNFFEGPIETQNRVHPTQKPLWLMKRIIQTFTKTGDVILDPFMGSGTTLVAAQELGRSTIGIEINPEYCEAARKRLMQQAMVL